MRQRGVAVSVIIPVHNDSRGVRRCLEALRLQDIAAGTFEVVVCDNASRSDPVTPDVLAGLEPLDVRLLSTEEPGSYRARNACLEVATGQVLAFTDADCTPHRTWLSAGLAALSADGLEIAAGDVIVTTSASPSPLEVWEERNGFPQEKYVTTLGFGVTANLFVRRNVMDRIGPFDEKLFSGGDREFCQRAVQGGARIGFVSSAAVSHPARSTAIEVAQKTRRVLRGRHDMGLPGPSVLGWIREARPPLGAFRRSRTFAERRRRALYVIGEVQAHYIRWWLTREHLGA